MEKYRFMINYNYNQNERRAGNIKLMNDSNNFGYLKTFNYNV